MPAAISTELIASILGFLFTVLVLSYLIGDNPLFRFAIYVFVGVSAGYAASVAWHQVLWPRLVRPLFSGTGQEKVLLLVPMVLGMLLVTKLSPRLSRLGNPAMAYLVGVGAAVAIGGAVVGTLIPQTQATINLPGIGAILQDGGAAESFAEGLVIILGTISTLAYFHYGMRSGSSGPVRSRLVTILSWIGRIFIAITFGVLFAGIMAAALTALIERLYFLWTFASSFF